MRFEVEVVSDGAAFEDQPELEIIPILEKVCNRLEDGMVSNVILDSNGNVCGHWRLDTEAD
jgi:hypothetical protein